MGLFFRRTNTSTGLTWVCGMIFMWAVSFVFAVPFVYLRKSHSLLTKCIAIACAIIFVLGLAAYIAGKVKGEKTGKSTKLTVSEIVYLGIFLGIVVFQLYKAVFYSYTDGDDAFYVATAQIANSSDTMYRINPYHGGFITLESKRYWISPFPMWVASLARISGMNVAILSHVFLPLFLIPVTYVIYNAIGDELFPDSREKKYMFLVLIAVIALFSGFSYSSAERFMLTRTRQGKEALANVIIPFVFLLLMKISKKAEEGSKKDIPTEYLFLLLLSGFAGALTSVFSNVLLSVMTGALVLYLLFVKKRIKTGLLTAFTLIPEAAVLMLYLIL